jgi:hypothetical protein
VIYNGNNKTVGTGYGPTTGFNTNGSDWTTPSLPDGAYTWKALLQNSSGLWSLVWTATQTFTLDTSAPQAPTAGSTQFPPNQVGGAFDTRGVFVVANDHTNNVTGYLFMMDGDLASTTYAANHGTAWTTTTVLKPQTIYFAKADNSTGTGTVVVNGSAGLVFAPGTVGAHTLYVKAVDQAGSTSPQTTYPFYAGASNPTFVSGDKMIAGWVDSTGTVPPATTTSAGGHLIVQPNSSGSYFADGFQGLLANNGSAKVARNDTATFFFTLPSSGPWDIGANVTTGVDYGTYTLTLDAGTANALTLIQGFDAYSDPAG